ncbi:MAG: RimK/LysX family protein, partial [Halieaceae bacterium]
VISLGIVLGSIRQQAEFTLSNRSHLDYQVLIGRNILSDVMIVDVSETNIAPPVGVSNLPDASGSP